MQWKYLRQVNETCWILDHRLTPEVRAMFSAMASRMPTGGIQARYQEVVGSVAESLWPNADERFAGDEVFGDETRRLRLAEERLCEYPLHPKVQEFFDQFVLRYGHGSIKELTGSPAVCVQGVSPCTAYLSFDNPLVAGQEFSTRAVRRKDWPMCREAFIPMEAYAELVGPGFADDAQYIADSGMGGSMPHPELKALHEEWLALFEAEVEAWKLRFSTPDGRAMYGVKDKEPFRPALDRARWALPSTIATGFSHTANVRTMGRVIADGKSFAEVHVPTCSVPGAELYRQSKVWDLIQEAYEEALPGMKGMWMREAVAGEEHPLPGHLRIGDIDRHEEVLVVVRPSGLTPYGNEAQVLDAYVRKPGNYLDPVWNQLVQVELEFQCSWAVARDWHRHRTGHPWHLNIVVSPSAEFMLHDRYEVISDYAFEVVGEGGNACSRFENLLDRSRDLYARFRDKGDMEKAMLCLPFGATVSMRTTMGLRDAVYMLELRANAHGANFEYEAQAKEALKRLRRGLGSYADSVWPPK